MAKPKPLKFFPTVGVLAQQRDIRSRVAAQQVYDRGLAEERFITAPRHLDERAPRRRSPQPSYPAAHIVPRPTKPYTRESFTDDLTAYMGVPQNTPRNKPPNKRSKFK
jgi:hypothetical protein